MQPFDYVKPNDLSEVVQLLSQAKGQAKLLAGGTDLLISMTGGGMNPELLIDIKGVPEMAGLEFKAAQGMRLGAAVTMAELAADSDVRKYYPMLAEACEAIGSPAIRNRATLGGNLCHGSPGADTAPALICYDAMCTIIGEKGERIVPLSEFFADRMQTILAPAETLVSLTLAAPVADSAGVYQMFRQGRGGYITLVSVAVHVDYSEENPWAWRIALGSAAPTPIRCRAAEDILRGSRPKSPQIEQAASLARADARPTDDFRASASYRSFLVEVLARRGIEETSARLARGIE
ncbi:MAG: xanthine dehydrogenase family protein subunit M [Caldilineales bacterium]|nr:xanthine dehydrogenase family protein subunit M [Caldilineales bacterium]